MAHNSSLAVCKCTLDASSLQGTQNYQGSQEGQKEAEDTKTEFKGLGAPAGNVCSGAKATAFYQ